jgi:hypothetical protein
MRYVVTAVWPREPGNTRRKRKVKVIELTGDVSLARANAVAHEMFPNADYITVELAEKQGAASESKSKSS